MRSKRTPVRLAALAAATAMLTGCTGGGPDLSEHRDREFTVAYPASWHQVASSAPQVRFAVTDTGSAAPGAALQVIVYADSGSLERAARDFVTRSRIAPGLRHITSAKTQVPGAPAAYRISKDLTGRSDDGSAVQVHQTDLLTVVPDGDRFDLRFPCRADHCARYGEQTLLDSVSIHE